MLGIYIPQRILKITKSTQFYLFFFSLERRIIDSMLQYQDTVVTAGGFSSNVMH